MIDDPPLLTIRREFERADRATLERLAGVQTGPLSDALGGGGALDPAVKPLDPARSAFVGSALPCETGPADNLALMAAVAVAKPGDVIMAAADGFLGAAVLGDNVLMMARNAGVAAIVVDGAVRDVAGILPVGVPVFARGVTPASCARSGPGRVGLPAVVGGVAVDAGDVVLGDADGVVVVPRSALPGVLARLDEVLTAERALQSRIADGITQLDLVERLLASNRVRYVP